MNSLRGGFGFLRPFLGALLWSFLLAPSVLAGNEDVAALAGWSYSYATEESRNAEPGLIPEEAWTPVQESRSVPMRPGVEYLWFRAPLPAGAHQIPSVYLEYPPDIIRIVVDTGEVVVIRTKDMAWPLQTLDRRGGTLYILIHASRGLPGIVVGPTLYGDRAALIPRLVGDNVERLLMGILFMVGGFGAFFLKAFRRSEPLILNGGLFALSGGFFILIQNPIIVGVVGIGSERALPLQLVSVMFLPIGLLGFIAELTTARSQKLIRAFNLWHILLAAAGVVAGTFSAALSFDLTNLFYASVIIDLPIISIIVLREAKNGGTEARVFAAGYLAFAVVGLRDSWVGMRLTTQGVADDFWGVHRGMTIFFLSLLFIVIHRFFRTRDEIAAAARAAEEMNRALSRFVPQEFLKRIGRNTIAEVRLGDAAGAELTILFMDMRQFTSHSEGMSPEDNFRFLNAFLGRIGPEIRRHGGFADKYIGDAVVALFPGRPDDAIRAAARMMEMLGEYNEERRAQGRFELEAGCGIHFGPVMLGTIGEPERMDGTVISDAVNVAARIQALSGEHGGGILVSEDARARLEHPGDFRFHEATTTAIRGRTKDVTFSALRESPVAR